MATRIRRNDRPLGDWRTYYEQIWKKPMADKPTEGMTLPQFTAAREALRGALAGYERVTPNCHSCKHFSMGACALHGEVPKEFQEQAEACESWSFDAIPF